MGILGNLYVQGFVSTSSDYRVKYNPVCLDGTFTVDHLNPLTYTNTLTKRKDIGFLAHEVEEHYPYLVVGKKDGDMYQSLNYNGLIGILTNEIKELKRQNVIQQQINAELQNQIDHIRQLLTTTTPTTTPTEMVDANPLK